MSGRFMKVDGGPLDCVASPIMVWSCQRTSNSRTETGTGGPTRGDNEAKIGKDGGISVGDWGGEAVQIARVNSIEPT